MVSRRSASGFFERSRCESRCLCVFERLLNVRASMRPWERARYCSPPCVAAARATLKLLWSRAPSPTTLLRATWTDGIPTIHRFPPPAPPPPTSPEHRASAAPPLHRTSTPSPPPWSRRRRRHRPGFPCRADPPSFAPPGLLLVSHYQSFSLYISLFRRYSSAVRPPRETLAAPVAVAAPLRGIPLRHLCRRDDGDGRL